MSSFLRKENLSQYKIKTQNELLISCFKGNLLKTDKTSSSLLFKKILKNLKLSVSEQLLLKKCGKIEVTPQEMFIFSFNNLIPVIGLRPKKVAGILYRLPCPIPKDRSVKLAIKWFFQAVKMRTEVRFEDRVFQELFRNFLASNLNEKQLSYYYSKLSGSLKKRVEWNKIALNNRMYVHYLKR